MKRNLSILLVLFLTMGFLLGGCGDKGQEQQQEEHNQRAY